MDNFHLEVTPVELTFQSKDPVSLSCLIKKVMPSGGAPERYEIRPSTQFSAGRATFQQGATFALSRDMELRNTRISLNFFNRNDRNACLIGSTDLDLATLPTHPYTLLELKLDNCSDPKARLKLEIQRREMQSKTTKKEGGKPLQMGLLRTQGQVREEAVISRRANPTLPTAYEISRRNYKQVEVGCHEEKKSEGKKQQGSNSSKKGSYLQQRVAVHGKATKLPIKHEERNTGESPLPRRQTPEPIRIGTKQEVSKPVQPTKYAISKAGSRGGHSHTSSIHTQPNIPTEQPLLEPQKLKVRPYRQNNSSHNASGREAFKPLKDDNGEKYRSIVQKFQKIHDQIESQESKVKQERSESSSEEDGSSQRHRSYFNNEGSRPEAVNSFAHSANSSNTHLQTPKIDQSQCSEVDPQAIHPQSTSPLDKQFQNIKSVKTKSPDASPPSEKTVSFQTIPERNLQPVVVRTTHRQEPLKQEEGQINDREIEMAEIQSYKREIQSLKTDLTSALRSVTDRDRSIAQLQKELQNYKEMLQEKQGLLGRLNQQYQMRFEEVFMLKERVAAFEAERQQKQQEKSALQSSTPLRQSDEALREELLKAKRCVVESESQLRFKENESRRLLLEMDNLKREKRSLEQEVQALVSKDKNEMTRQASLARIEQINSNSLANHTKRENEALRNEVKLLQQKLSSLNELFQSLLRPEERAKAKAATLPSVKESGELQRRVKLLQEKCGLLQEQLKEKKNQLAEIINVIWKHEDGDIMNEVLSVIAAERPSP